MNSNSPVNTFLDRLKSLFGKKAAVAAPAAAMTLNNNAVRAASPSSTAGAQPAGNESTDALQSSSNLPAFKQNNQSQGYQASRGADQAARRPNRVTSTYTKLQALSASGTGSASSGVQNPIEESGLHDILNQLDDHRKKS